MRSLQTATDIGAQAREGRLGRCWIRPDDHRGARQFVQPGTTGMPESALDLVAHRRRTHGSADDEAQTRRRSSSLLDGVYDDRSAADTVTSLDHETEFG